MCQRKEKLLRKCHGSKREKTADSVMPRKRNTAYKVSFFKNIYDKNIRLLAMCQASNSKFYLI